MVTFPVYDANPSQEQSKNAFDTEIKKLMAYLKVLGPAMIQASEEIAALADVKMYSPANSFSAPDVVIGLTTGKRYPCISETEITGDDPDVSVTGNWGEPFGVSLADLYEISPGKNKIVNSDFSINQDAVSGTVTLAPDEYGHDMFKGGGSGAQYTFSTSQNEVEVTITAGSLIQTVHGDFLRSGTYVAGWKGTAQVKIGGGSFGDSGITGAVVGGNNLDIEIGLGTIKNLQFEVGSNLSTYEPRLHDGALCRLFYEIVSQGIGGGIICPPTVNSTSQLSRGASVFFTPKISIPSITISGTSGNWLGGPTVSDVTTSSFRVSGEARATTLTTRIGNIIIDARL